MNFREFFFKSKEEKLFPDHLEQRRFQVEVIKSIPRKYKLDIIPYDIIIVNKFIDSETLIIDGVEIPSHYFKFLGYI